MIEYVCSVWIIVGSEMDVDEQAVENVFTSWRVQYEVQRQQCLEKVVILQMAIF